MKRALVAAMAAVMLLPATASAHWPDLTGCEPGEDDRLPFAEPREGLIDIREEPWQWIEVHPDGRTLDVYYYNGVEHCFGLDRIEISSTDTGLDVRVFTGKVPDAGACRYIALRYVTTVELDEPLITGGRDYS